MSRFLLAAWLLLALDGNARADSTHVGFDAAFYLARNPDVAAAGVDPYQHFMSYGWREGRDPHAYFSIRGYLSANPDVAAAGMNPLVHYLWYGVTEGRLLRPRAALDPLTYMAQSRACDGNTATPLRASDPIACRLFDAAHEQVVDSFLVGSGAVSAMTFTPWGQWSEPAADPACQGAVRPSRCSDGGDQYRVDDDVVYAPVTRDGGTPYDKWLVGANCGAGQNGGWLLFRTDASEDWKEAVAGLAVASDPNACPPLASAYTRYARRLVTAPAIGPVDTIVTEHYSHSTAAASHYMERMMFGRGWGRWAWMAFSREPSPYDVTRHCPDFGWNDLPGWYLTVCRISTNVELADSTLSGAQLWSPR